MATDRMRQRERGHPTEHIGFRCPKELVEAAATLDRDRSKGLVRLLDQAHDARIELGQLWVEIEVFARREGISEGAALGRLAREALEARGVPR
jgi:hypothetical protein